MIPTNHLRIRTNATKCPDGHAILQQLWIDLSKYDDDEHAHHYQRALRRSPDEMPTLCPSEWRDVPTEQE